MQDKPLAEITRRISNYADYIILTRPQNERSAAPERVREFLVDFPEPVDLTRDIPSALARAQEVARPDDLILITGSLFTVAEAKKVFENQNSKY
ncbi:MAG: hypothetical protein GWM98_05575 [Nitrospinaceae bacterium]|nr:hypothetical protein [Nitrospinaceae bacterium]NIR54032.1 hypothetical protein [Nitrospinaceae bacterium]NIS84449.1 hypothetical protein [Nitrospinaceae bacterium]NIT81245.1 hypothetical protein [Nitrospinaceae bacterium]NIU43532.1 hypothetical protein [Nitrospinaceae bacterium]